MRAELMTELLLQKINPYFLTNKTVAPEAHVRKYLLNSNIMKNGKDKGGWLIKCFIFPFLFFLLTLLHT